MKNNNYMVITADGKIKVKEGFATWEDAYHWALNHDFGQYEEHGGLRVFRNFKI